MNRPFESEIHGTVKFTYFCCVLLVTWCYRALLCAIFSQRKIQQMCAICSFEVAAWFNTFGEIAVNVKFTHPNSRINSR